MTRDEYERRKLRIEEQLRAGIELMESAYRAEIRPLLPPRRRAPLQDLTRFGALRVEKPGGGQRATAYRKTGADPSLVHA